MTTLSYVILAMGVGRILIGLAPFLAPVRSSALLGFPASHDSSTARLMARMFAVREFGLGALTFYAVAHPELLTFVIVLQALTDLGDLVAIGIPLVKREGIDRAAWTSAGFALPAGLAWVAVLFVS